MMPTARSALIAAALARPGGILLVMPDGKTPNQTERLAAALRENLRRRKAQTRAKEMDSSGEKAGS